MISEENLRKLIKIFRDIVDNMSESRDYSKYSVFHFNDGILNGLQMALNEEIIPPHIKDLLERKENSIKNLKS